MFMGLKFTFPGRFVSPLGFLGMITFVSAHYPRHYWCIADAFYRAPGVR